LPATATSSEADTGLTGSTVLPDTTPGATSDQLDDYRFQNAWHIAWKPSDTSSLSPTPPSLPCTTLSTWLPGDVAPTPGCSNDINGDTDEGAGNTLMGLAIGLPVGIFFLIFFCCLGCCYVRNRDKRKKKTSPQPVAA
jgi:hypothetical protein